MSGNNGLYHGQWLAACLFGLALDVRDCSFGIVIASAHRQPAWRFRQQSLHEKGKHRRDGAKQKHIVPAEMRHYPTAQQSGADKPNGKYQLIQ